MKLILLYMMYILGILPYLSDCVNKNFNAGMLSDIYEVITLELNVTAVTSANSRLMSVWMTWPSFKVMDLRIQCFWAYCYTEFSVHLDKIW